MQPETNEKLSQHPLWSKLSKQQQDFTANLIESKDEIEAAKASYACTSTKSARAVAAKLLRDWKIQNVLSYMGMSTQGALVSKQEALQLISTRLRSADIDAGAFVKLMAIYSEMKGWDEAAHKSGEQAPGSDIDEQVRAIERARRESNGKESKEDQSGDRQARQEGLIQSS